MQGRDSEAVRHQLGWCVSQALGEDVPACRGGLSGVLTLGTHWAHGPLCPSPALPPVFLAGGACLLCTESVRPHGP